MTALPPASGAPGPARPWYKRKRFIIPLVLLVLIIIIPKGGDAGDNAGEPAAAVSSQSDQTADESSAEEVAAQEQATAEAATKAEEQAAAEAAKKAEEQAAAEAAAAEQAAAEQAAAEQAAAAEAARIGTVSQQNAYRSAQSYLDFTAFSRAGLIGQLTSEYGEGFPPEDAEFAVARLEVEGGVDWNAEAAESAQSYLEMTSFSRQGLIDQLTSEYGEQFTLEQAEYGVSTTGL